MDKMIFICTGNTCRSPMAEKLGQKIAQEKGCTLTVLSRGLSVSLGDVAHEHAIRAIALFDMDLTKHVATQFTTQDCYGDCLFLTMTLQHKAFLQQHFPQIKNKVFTLKEYAGVSGDIVDPYNRPQQFYDVCAQELYTHLTKIFEKLQEENI